MAVRTYFLGEEWVLRMRLLSLDPFQSRSDGPEAKRFWRLGNWLCNDASARFPLGGIR